MKSNKGKLGIAVLTIVLIVYQLIIFVSRSGLGPNVYSFLLILGVVALALLAKGYFALKDSEKSSES